MELEIRAVTQKEYETDAKGVWGACFKEDGKTFIDYYFEKRSCRKNVVAAFINGKMAGALHILPKELCFGTVRKRTALIAGVGTLPEFRMQGVAAGLLRAAEPIALENGCSAAILQPFSFDFYRKFGYESFARCRAYMRLPAETGVPAILSDTLDAEKLRRIYCEFVKPYCGAAVRTEYDFRLLVEEARITGDLFVACEDGYAWGRSDEEETDLYELAGARPLALVDALALKYGRPVRYRLPDSYPGGKKEPFNMIKVLDETAFMKNMKLPKNFWRLPEYEKCCFGFERY